MKYVDAYKALVILPLFFPLFGQVVTDYYVPYVNFLMFGLGSMVLLFSKNQALVPVPLVFSLIIYAFFGMCSLVWSYATEITLNRALLNAVVISFIIIYSVKLGQRAKLEVLLLFGKVSILMVLGFSVPALVLGGDQFYHQGNFHGYFSNSNSLSHYVSVSALPAAIVFLKGSKGIERILYLAVILALVFILYAGNSRASIMAAFIAFLVFCAVVGGNKSLVYPLLLTFFVGFLAFFISQVLNKYDQINPLGTRQYLWLLHLSAIAERPILGWGLGVNPVDFKIYVPDNYNYLTDTEKGNSYYVVPEELGLPFSMILFYFLSFLLRDVKFCLSALRNRWINGVGAFPVLVILAGLFHGIFESWIFSFGNPLSILFWLSCVYVASNRILLKKGIAENKS